jgi:uncharacterized DUF497 family protein
MQYDWNSEKNIVLIETRGVSFEEALRSISEGGLLADEPHPNRDKYPNQRIMVVLIRNYCYVMPYVQNGDTLFLKTLIPSRKMTKRYLKGKKNEER